VIRNKGQRENSRCPPSCVNFSEAPIGRTACRAADNLIGCLVHSQQDTSARVGYRAAKCVAKTRHLMTSAELGAAHAAVIPQVAAASAAIRTFEGAMPIRAVERTREKGAAFRGSELVRGEKSGLYLVHGTGRLGKWNFPRPARTELSRFRFSAKINNGSSRSSTTTATVSTPPASLTITVMAASLRWTTLNNGRRNI
jgi:hypothetical protein